MILLQAPYDTLTYSIWLKNPLLGDNLILNTQSIFYKAQDGSTIGYKKTPPLKKHRLQFDDLTRTNALELLAFCADAAGSLVKYTDVTSQVWRGIIITNPVEILTTGPGRGINSRRKEANTVILEFEGVLIG